MKALVEKFTNTQDVINIFLITLKEMAGVLLLSINEQEELRKFAHCCDPQALTDEVFLFIHLMTKNNPITKS